jgi:hypothetical protein
MRTRGKVDANQPELVRYLRALGMSVTVTSAVGSGFPDLAVGFRGVTVLVEVKDGAKNASAQVLTAAQREWFGGWAGCAVVASTKEEAAQAVIAAAQKQGVNV